MSYRLRYGVVIFSICDAQFVFASRKAHSALPILIRIPEEISSIINDQNINASDLSSEAENKLKRLIRMGYIEEYCACSQ